MRRPDLAENQLTTFLHSPSKRSYQVYETDGVVWHRQLAHFPEPGQTIGGTEPTLAIGEFPVEFIMGSGHYVESYLLRDGEYLLQSAPAWYTKTNAYEMSPGYEGAHHRGLTRVVRGECLFCHVGSLEDDNDQRPVIGELAIGCQRCHGSGAEHAAHYQKLALDPIDDAGSPETREFEDPIVNPSKLSRRASESICAQCHLQGEFVVNQPGRKLTDFRPGEDFENTRMTYDFDDDTSSSSETFVGHFGQLWESKCYLESETMTCISCHDPHHAPPPAEIDRFQRKQCYQCHDDESCGVSLENRMRKQGNRCVGCHMPKVTSEIPHSPTTNHRIAVYDLDDIANGLHNRESKDEKSGSRKLKRIAPPGDDSDTERFDLLADAAWLMQDIERTGGRERLDELPRIESALAAYAGQHPKDAAIQTRLAALLYQKALLPNLGSSVIQQTWKRAGIHARQALGLDAISDRDRLSAQKVLAEWYYEAENFAAAAEHYQRLTRERRVARDHYNLGIILGKRKDLVGAEAALREAIRVDGGYELPYRSLSILYRSLNPQLSQQMSVIASYLEQQNRSEKGSEKVSGTFLVD